MQFGVSQYGVNQYGLESSSVEEPDTGDNRRQYFPVASTMTQANAALSVRSVTDMADAVNNYTRYVGSHKIIGQVCVPAWQSHDSTTEERVICAFSPRSVPLGYSEFLVVLRYQRTSGTGSTTWKVYSSPVRLRSDVNLDPTELRFNAYECEFTCDKDDMERGAVKLRVSRGLFPRGTLLASYLILTAQNSDASTRSSLFSIDVHPYTQETD